MGPIWGRQAPCWPHVGPMNLVIWGIPFRSRYIQVSLHICTSLCNYMILSNSILVNWCPIHVIILSIFEHNLNDKFKKHEYISPTNWMLTFFIVWKYGWLCDENCSIAHLTMSWMFQCNVDFSSYSQWYKQLSGTLLLHQNGDVIISIKFSSLASREVVKMKTFSAAIFCGILLLIHDINSMAVALEFWHGWVITSHCFIMM